MKTTLTCPANRLYTLVMDPTEIFPDDPGNGTPLMVYGPRGASGTFDCALNTGELSCGDRDLDLPQGVLDWLASDAVDAAIADFWEAHP